MDISESSSQPPTTSISTRFNLDHWDMQDTDTLLLSSDEVFFYVHQLKLLPRSSNHFGGLLVDNDTQGDREMDVDVNQPMSDTMFSFTPKLIVMGISSDVLNVILLALYSFLIQTYRPSPVTLQGVIHTLVALGYDLNDIASPCSDLYEHLLKAANEDPLNMYAVAARYSFESLAVPASSMTLKVSLSEVTDELAQQMGPIYLRRLFFLHLGRADALKRVVLPPPNLHPPDPNTNCNVESQKAINRAWTLASAYIISQRQSGSVWDAVTLLGTGLKCPECRRSLEERVSRLVRDWSAVKYTI